MLALEHRHEGNEPYHVYAVFPGAPADSFDLVYFGQAQVVDSVYAETELPLVSPAKAIPGIRRLDLQLAGRFEHYAVSASTQQQFAAGPAVRTATNAPYT